MDYTNNYLYLLFCKHCNLKTNHNHEAYGNYKGSSTNILLTCLSCNRKHLMYGDNAELLYKFKKDEVIL